MIHRLHEVQIEIDTPAGNVFRGFGRAVAFQTIKQALIECRGNWVNYVSLRNQSEMTVETRNGCRRFLLKNAMARLDRGELSILAETATSPNEKTFKVA